MTQDLPKQDAVVLELSDDDLDEIEWLARDAPLRLVAQTIRSMGDKARSAAIKKKLEGRIGRDFTWKTWWDRVLPAVRESRYFLYRDRQPITLAARVDSIPDQAWESLPTPVKSSKKKSPLDIRLAEMVHISPTRNATESVPDQAGNRCPRQV